jgi:hypothetical protein
MLLGITMDEATKFQTLVQFRVPEVLSGMIESAADKHLQSKSEYIRQSVLTALSADGFDPAAIPPRDAGSLYNVQDGKRRYALVDGDRLITWTDYVAEKPDAAAAAPHEGAAWLPLEYEDSEPFDPALHWRGHPEIRIEPDRVVRTYPIIVKSLEAM